MLVRKFFNEVMTDNFSSLMEYLGIKKDVSGIQKISQDIELIAPVPFHLTAENENNLFSWTLSTFDIDRYGERVDPAGWDYKSYLQNPVVEWAHRYDIPAIGKIERLAIDENGLHGSVIFNSKDYDPFGWAIGERVKNGVIRAGSVGFRVLEIEIPDKKTQEEGTFLIFRKQELLEFSICNVPANPFALAKTGKQEHEKSDLAVPYWGGLIQNL